MDETLTNLFEVLCSRIEELRLKNPSLDMEEVDRISILIQSYLDGFKIFTEVPEQKDAVTHLPELSFEELCKLTRPPRNTPKGSIGPSQRMVLYAEKKDTMRAKRVDRVIKMAKDIEARKHIPFF